MEEGPNSTINAHRDNPPLPTNSLTIDGKAQLPAERNKILAILRKHKDELANRFGVLDIALFGSVIRNTATPDSDIDILVRLDDRKGWTRSFDLQDFLEDKLGWPVDLVVKAELRAELRGTIEAEAIHV